MQTFDDVRKANISGPTALTIGNFDGIHRGHQALLARLKIEAETLAANHGGQACSAFLTFDPHPLRVLRPDHLHLLLTTPRERLVEAAALGIDLGIIHPFDLETAKLSPRTFVETLKRHLGLAALVVGPDFALGRNRAGDVPALEALGQELDFRVVVIDPVQFGHHPVRSSHIRRLLQDGEVSAAAELLGRPYRVSGVVERGDQRGRTVGIPTANIRPPSDKLVPADGVYATRTLIATFDRVHIFNSVTNVGVRPTVDGLHHRVETHILDFPPPGQIDDLYGQTLAVEFIARLRGEIRFASVGELVEQIHVDIAQARSLFTA
ncbi:MAG: bifunctional riboflavin kinase/FAD synthetase [Caldilineaceae bacterium]|nr:bifunctional riboflavin kinase/FAD synthetase [Caldilineaceae bacterium]